MHVSKENSQLYLLEVNSKLWCQWLLEHFTLIEGIWCPRNGCIILHSLVTFPNLAKASFGILGRGNNDWISRTALLTSSLHFACLLSFCIFVLFFWPFVLFNTVLLILTKRLTTSLAKFSWSECKASGREESETEFSY